MIIQNATILNEGECYEGSVLIRKDRIEQISRNKEILTPGEEVLDAQGAFLLPGIIDTHVHMREPGLTAKADMESETRAAVAGGVTSVFDMPNVNPQTTTNELILQRKALAAGRCHANYTFYLGATNDNVGEVCNMDPTTVPGLKVFMGSSTGNMLVDREKELYSLFRECPNIVVAHCEDMRCIQERLAEAKQLYGDDPDVKYHSFIRSEEACYRSTKLAISIAQSAGARLHVAHLSTARELQLFQQKQSGITAEVCLPHLLFCDEDYERLGTRIKCNPSVKTKTDRDALRAALNDDRIETIGTDHAPHLLQDKQGGALKAASGIPMIQFSLPSMLGLSNQGIVDKLRIVELMCHRPARLFRVKERGFIREGYYADLVLVRPVPPYTICKEDIQSKCGWSPLEGSSMSWKIEKTWVNGHLAWKDAHISSIPSGMPLSFNAL